MLLAINFDITANLYVRGLSDAGIFQLPAFHQEDQIPIEFQAFRRVSYFGPPIYEVVSLTGYNLEICVGTAGAKRATCNAWSLNAAEDTLTGTLDLQTAEITALEDRATQLFEAILTGPGTRYRTSAEVKIRKSVSLAANVNPVPLGTPITMEQAIALFLPRRDLRSFTMKSLPNGTKRGLVYLDDDGALQARPL